MLNKTDAYELVTSFLQKKKIEFKVKILDESTIEDDFGWVFFYDIDSEDPNERIGGNAPIFVDKYQEKVFSSGTRLPVEDYILSYKKYKGDIDEFMKACR